jgi:hypothetical protein
MGIFPNSQVFWADPAFRGDGCRLSHYQRRAADGKSTKMNKMPVIGVPIHARILAHWRDANPVSQLNVAQLQRRE